MSHGCKGLSFANCRSYTRNFWFKHAGRGGRWTISVRTPDDEETGPEAERFVPRPPQTPLLTEVAALRLPRPTRYREAELVTVS